MNDGYVLVDKPKGWTSFDVVAKVRGIARAANRHAMTAGLTDGRQLAKRVKAGHTGTLDPLATGLLVVLIGAYTKRAAELTKLDKTYAVTMKLGEVSTTADEEGRKTYVSDVRPNREAVETALAAYTGRIMQVPPAFSAMKVGGKRAYELARAGKDVTLEARPVTVYENLLTSYSYPYVHFISHVSSGTYIRSLVEDLGKQLQTGAYMSDLRRLKVGSFDVDDALLPEAIVLPQSLRAL